MAHRPKLNATIDQNATRKAEFEIDGGQECQPVVGLALGEPLRRSRKS